MPEATKPKRTRTSTANSQTISLKSGGTITLSGTGINPFTMSADDLAFVTELASKLRNYGAVGSVGSAPAKGAPSREAYEHATGKPS